MTIWRNLFEAKTTELEDMLWDARHLSEDVFKSAYGSRVFRYFAPDNSVRVISEYRKPVIVPHVHSLSERKSSPRSGDLVLIVSDDGNEYGRISWVRRDDDIASVYLFSIKRSESFSLDCFETYRNRNTRWRIVQ